MFSIPINLKVEIKKYKEEEKIDIKNIFLPPYLAVRKTS